MSHVLFDWKIGALFNNKKMTPISGLTRTNRLNSIWDLKEPFFFPFGARIPQRALVALIALALRFSCGKHTRS